MKKKPPAYGGPSPIGTPSLKGVTHNTQKKNTYGPTLLRHLAEGNDVICLQELTRAPELPLVFAQGENTAFLHCNVGPGVAHGTAVVLSPRLFPFAKGLAHFDQDGLTAAVEVRLPHCEPLVIVSCYCPPPPLS